MTSSEAGSIETEGCTACGGAFRVAADWHADRSVRVRCPHCGHSAAGPIDLARMRHRTAAFALSALLLFTPAVLLPITRIDRLGHARETGVLDGVAALAADDHVWLASLVFICSVVIPLSKLLGLFVLSTTRIGFGSSGRRRAWRCLEVIGRWGMLDVLLVAALVALVKLGDLVRIEPGIGAAFFSVMVIFSLLASASFDPRAIRSETNP